MKRPRPAPGFERPPVFTRPNFSKMRRCWSAGIPGPWSSTVTSTWPSSAPARTSISSPATVYLAALVTRLRRSCRRRSRSPRTAGSGQRVANVGRDLHLVVTQLDHRGGLVDELGKIDVGEHVREGARLDSRRVEHVSDQGREPPGLLLDEGAKRLALFGGELARALAERGRAADHRGHRRTELVRDEGDEVGPERREAAQLLRRIALGRVRAQVLNCEP